MATIKYIEIKKSELKKKDPIVHILYFSGRDIFTYFSKLPATARRFIEENGKDNTVKVSRPGYKDGKIIEHICLRVYPAGYNIPFYIRTE